MKIILLFAALAMLGSCTENGKDTKIPCDKKLWQLVKNCNPVDTTDCSYMATYGESAITAGTISVNKKTFNFYNARGNANDGSICWQGTK